MNKLKFYILSFTWGLPLTLMGCIVAAALMIAGKKPKRHGYCYYFEVGDNWGGLELGVFFLVDKNSNTHIRNHELGHAIQNCYFGPAMLFIVCIPSAIRYWYREYLLKAKKVKALKPYDSIWFERQATEWGYAYERSDDNGM